MAGNSSDYYEILVKFPRVTKILQALPKNLQWWGYKLGVEAMLQVKPEHPRILDANKTATENAYETLKALGRQGEVVTPSNALSSAADRGTDIHHIAASFFQKGEIPKKDDVPEEHHGYVKALAKWWNLWKQYHGAEIFCTEETVYSLEHMYAGTLDLILRCGDRFHIMDFKTSKGIYESHLLQVAAYKHAACEMGLIPLGSTTTARVVRLGVKGDYQEVASGCTIEDFLKVKEVWALLERLKEGGGEVAAMGISTAASVDADRSDPADSNGNGSVLSVPTAQD